MWNASSTSDVGNPASKVGEVQASSTSASTGVGTQEPVSVGVQEATLGSARMKGREAAYQKARLEILCQGWFLSLLHCNSCPFQRATMP
jgi:hypothetical protein